MAVINGDHQLDHDSFSHKCSKLCIAVAYRFLLRFLFPTLHWTPGLSVPDYGVQRAGLDFLNTPL